MEDWEDNDFGKEKYENNLLQEVINFKNYGDCLTSNEYRLLKNYLKKRILKEYTVDTLIDLFEDIFDQNEIDSPKATITTISELPGC